MSDLPRRCGPCSACCTVIAVPELQKPADEPCRHLCASGCGIHPDRPESCQRFECQWLRGVLEVDGTTDPGLRPDVCGVILDYRPDSVFGEAYVAWEVEAGASTAGAAKAVLDGLSERFLVVLSARGPGDTTDRDDPRFLGPPDRVREARDVMATRRSGR